ncbi:MAG: NUDIX domain-containing protein [Tannerellaceae bacterium]|nr:NUDIX domain-containing protein [Tannerellaceae bacterium]
MNHPLDQFRYCPSCGDTHFEIRNEKAKQCSACGFVYYFNPSASTACFLKNRKGELLVVRRAKDPAIGTLDLPGGFADRYETAEESVVREIKEETGLVPVSCRYLFSLPNIYLFMGFSVHTLDLFFECVVDEFDHAAACDDAAEILILRPEELDPQKFGLDSIKKAVDLYRTKY